MTDWRLVFSPGNLNPNLVEAVDGILAAVKGDVVEIYIDRIWRVVAEEILRRRCPELSEKHPGRNRRKSDDTG